MPWSSSDLPPSVKNKNWSAHQIEVFVAAANAALKEYGDDGKAIAVGTAAAEHASKEKENAKQFPKIFYCRHMVPGVCRYEGVENGKPVEEHVYIDADAMKNAAASMIGKPVFVQHQKVNLDTVEADADGWVTDCFYNELDGWLWSKNLAISDEAHRAVDNGWSVSNAYKPKEWDGKGQHLNVDYDRKIRNYEFTHLAIVPNPRYEDAKIFSPEEFKAYQAEKKAHLEEMQNSKPIKPESSIMFFRAKKEEVKAGETILDTDFAEIKNDDGTVTMVTVGELKDAKRKEKLNAKKNEKQVDDDDAEVEIDGEKVNMGDLKECYKNMKGMKKNAEDEEEKEKAKKEKEKENAEKEEEEKRKEKEKEKENSNSKIRELLNASNKKPVTSSVTTVIDKKRRGTELFGSGTK